MMNLTLSYPLGLLVGAPLALGLAAWSTWRLRRRLAGSTRWCVLAGLRAAALLATVVLLAAPMYVESQDDLPQRNAVVVLVDRSESMALEDGGARRYQQALDFIRERLSGPLRKAGYRTTAMAFAEDAQTATGDELAKLAPDGRRTNVGRALLRAVSETEPPPRAVVVLSDGGANDDGDNRRALSALVENRTPVIGIGFGSEAGPRTATIQYVEGPPSAPPRQAFRVTAGLESGGEGELPAFDLVLLRDGRFEQKRTVPASPAGRVWTESFEVTAEEAGLYRYTIQAVAADSPAIRWLDVSGAASVRVANEKDLRVLFVQGALTWDYKFIRIALLGDPAIRLTGLSRTSTSSVFYQNVEDADELKGGFPTRIEQLAPFSVVVLASLRHDDLTVEQQELLSRFCGEFGGGVLMIGGPETFDSSWRDSRLEELLAVRFSPVGATPPEAPFNLRLTPEALADPVFRTSDAEEPEASWSRLPPFTNYARVEAVKPGAEVWAVHPQDRSAEGPRVLMAAQRFGGGRSAVIGVQNFWRWRLARDSDPKAFDRFWQQLLRRLAEGGREQLSIVVADQTLGPGGRVRATVQRGADPRDPTGEARPYLVRATDERQAEAGRSRLEIAAGRAAEFEFATPTAGAYRIEVSDENGLPLAGRTVEIRDVNLEWRRPARDMRQLEQWAAVSYGTAVKVEECGSVEALLEQVIERADEAARRMPRQEPAGMSGWTLLLLAACLGTEWVLKKRWGLR